MARLRLRELEEYLQELEVFDKPKILLEQYPTSGHIAANILYTAQSQFNDLENCLVADLGTGCGTLALGAQMLGAASVIGFEIDRDALQTFYNNCREMELDIEAVQCDVLQYLPGLLVSHFFSIRKNYK